MLVCVHNSFCLVLFLLFRSHKQQCPATVWSTGVTEPGALVVQKLSIEHTCAVAEHYSSYPDVRNVISTDDQATMATMFSLDLSASSIAVYLRQKGYDNITLKDISNWRSKLRHQNGNETENEVIII